MNKIRSAITRVLGGAARSFARYPAAMTGALVIAIVATVRIHLDTQIHDQLFTSLQLAFLFGSVLAMAVTVLMVTQTAQKWPFWLANLVAMVVVGATFAIIHLPAGDLTGLVVARIIALTFTCLMLFLLFISRDAASNDFNQASFLTLKAALIAAVYALVILLGLMFIAFTVESLLYKNMSEKVYLNIAVWSAFAWFAFFLGYFPDFGRERLDPHLETARRQPRFIEILFVSVLIPLMTLLTLVLLIWAIQILAVADWPSFSQLSVIFTAYTLFGIFLSVMVSHDRQALARWYRRIFPVAALVFLVFEAYAWITQIRTDGLLLNTYFIAVLWLFAVFSTLVLLLGGIARNRLMAWLAIGLSILVVLPWIGYHEAPVLAQTRRLQSVLLRNDMLDGERIQPAPASISSEDRITISRAAGYLLDADNAKKADWFTGSIRSFSEFRQVFGFDYILRTEDPIDKPAESFISLFEPGGSLPIEGYSLVAYAAQMTFGGQFIEFEADGASFRVELIQSDGGQDIALSVQKNQQEILLNDLRPWLDDLALRYPDAGSRERNQAPELADMSLALEIQDTRLLVIFQTVSIFWHEENEQDRSYHAVLDSVFYQKK